MFAISIDATLYTFRYSPLGLLSANVRWVSDAPPLSNGVHLYEWQEAAWVSIQWPAQLWWLRFFLVGHDHFRGGRHEATCHYDRTSQFLAWWLRSTSLKDRMRFFRCPDVPRLLRAAHQNTSRTRNPWLYGHAGLLHAVRRIHQALKTARPAVLRPCFDHTAVEQWQYSHARSVRVAKELLQAMEQRTSATAFLIPYRVFESELLSRYGALMSEAMETRQGAAVQLPCAVSGAQVHRYRELGCSILDFNGDRFITLCSVEQMWNTFAGALCRLMEHAEVVLLDAPTPVRRAAYTAVHRLVPETSGWVVDSAATVSNLQEELGALATTPRHLPSGPFSAFVVDGMHRMGLRQQADLLQFAASASSIRLVILGGDTTGKGLSRGRALDGWTLCCHALHRGGGNATNVEALGAADFQTSLSILLGAPTHRLHVWSVGTVPGLKQAIRFAQCVDTHTSVDGECERRWVCAPVPNSHMVSWVCHNMTLTRGTMMVVNWESDCRALAAQQRGIQSIVEGFELCDQTEPYIGQDVRCVVAVRGRLKVGELVRVVGPAAGGGSVVLQRLVGEKLVQLAKDELKATCRPARLAPLYEQLNSHYAKRPVVVILSHTSQRGPAMRQEWDPLYTGLGLGGNRNVTIVANRQGLDAAKRRMGEVLACQPPDIPPIWQQFVVTLVNSGVVKSS
jgi:hypothetical protein